ncbi:MAG TPA: hypothetical protein PK339_12460 [Flavitalea sp.]|nr:hypothetical protein [Flavitalea sp.]
MSKSTGCPNPFEAKAQTLPIKPMDLFDFAAYNKEVVKSERLTRRLIDSLRELKRLTACSKQ